MSDPYESSWSFLGPWIGTQRHQALQELESVKEGLAGARDE